VVHVEGVQQSIHTDKLSSCFGRALLGVLSVTRCPTLIGLVKPPVINDVLCLVSIDVGLSTTPLLSHPCTVGCQLHPYSYVEVIFYTHKIRGLHQNDFVMAAKTDNLWTDFVQVRTRVD